MRDARRVGGRPSDCASPALPATRRRGSDDRRRGASRSVDASTGFVVASSASTIAAPATRVVLGVSPARRGAATAFLEPPRGDGTDALERCEPHRARVVDPTLEHRLVDEAFDRIQHLSAVGLEVDDRLGGGDVEGALEDAGSASARLGSVKSTHDASIASASVAWRPGPPPSTASGRPRRAPSSSRPRTRSRPAATSIASGTPSRRRARILRDEPGRRAAYRRRGPGRRRTRAAPASAPVATGSRRRRARSPLGQRERRQVDHPALSLSRTLEVTTNDRRRIEPDADPGREREVLEPTAPDLDAPRGRATWSTGSAPTGTGARRASATASPTSAAVRARASSTADIARRTRRASDDMSSRAKRVLPMPAVPAIVTRRAPSRRAFASTAARVELASEERVPGCLLSSAPCRIP